MLTHIRAVRTAATSLCVVASTAKAQEVPTRALDRLEVEHAAQFTDVAGIRELRDGRVVVLDAREQALKLVDMKAGTVKAIGRVGHGPGEYQLPLALYAVPGDSAVIFDMANSARPMVVTPGGTPGGVLPGLPDGGFLDNLSQIDGLGRLYRAGHARGAIIALERLDRAKKRVDTVGYVSRSSACSNVTSTPAEPDPKSDIGRASTRRNAFTMIEEWAVAADGRIGIACPEPYTVALIAPGGRRTSNAPIPYDRQPFGAAELKRWREAQKQPAASIRITSDGKQTAGYDNSPMTILEPDTWPEYLPSFVPMRSLGGAVSFAPDGDLWIQRAMPVDAAPMIDVIGRDGHLAYHLTLPKHTRLVGFGVNSVYLVRIDDDDIQHLQRYSLIGQSTGRNERHSLSRCP